MTSKEALDLLKTLPGINSEERVRLDPVYCHDLIRLGLAFGTVSMTKYLEEINFPMLAFITSEGKKRLADEENFHEWWEAMSHNDMYSAECMEWVLATARNFNAWLPAANGDVRIPGYLGSMILGELTGTFPQAYPYEFTCAENPNR